MDGSANVCCIHVLPLPQDEERQWRTHDGDLHRFLRGMINDVHGAKA